MKSPYPAPASKEPSFRLAFYIVGVAVSLFFIFFGKEIFRGDRLKLETQIMKIKIGFNSTVPVTDFDPGRIRLASEAVVLDNLFSPLLRSGKDGTIYPDAAERFYWEGNEIHFVMRSDLQTVDGDPITARDAEFTFKRLLLDRDNAHGDLQTFLCPQAKLKSIEDSCEGIQVKGNQLILKVAKSEYRPFLIQMLVNMDFGIIPQLALDNSVPMPKIKNYRKTSGPYYVEKNDGGGAYVLRANPHHWITKQGIPEILEFHPSSLPDEPLIALKNGDVDYISGIDTEASSLLSELRKDPSVNFFDTHPIKKFIVATTIDQLGDFSAEERQAVFHIVRTAFFKELAQTDWKPSAEFFPVFGEGALTRNQLSEFKTWSQRASTTPVHRPFTLGVLERRLELFKKIFKGNPLVKIVEVKSFGAFLERKERPDFYATGIDSGFYESINLISYNISQELFDLTPQAGRVWLSDYMSRPEKEQRIAMLRDLHYDALRKGLMGVIAEAPYSHVTRKPFRYDGSKFYAGSELWLLRRD